jgi:hypothetical protein
MLKPHHGLLPTLLLCHRMIKHKKFWTIVKDPDFISLATATVTYLLVCFLFFGDYIQDILPDVIDLYIVGSEEMAVSATLYYGFAILVFMLVMLCVPIEKPKQRIVFWFYFSALISLIPYAIQMKGYHYHLMPTLVFFFVGLFTMLNFWLEKFVSQHKRLFILTLFAVMLAYMMTPLRPEYPDHKTYNTFQITKMIDACRSCSSFFIFNDSIAITHPTSLYTRMPHASRFPAFWFLPYLMSQEGLMMRGKKTDLDPEVLKSYIEKYRQMVAEDLLRYKPELLFIGRFQIITDNTDTFNFIEYFSENEDFRKEWQNYKKLKEIDINQRVYFKGTYLDKDNIIRYDVYHREDTR